MLKKQVAISFSDVEKIEGGEDQVLSVPHDSRIFELPSGGYVVLPAARAKAYDEKQLASIVAHVDAIICGDDGK